MNLLGIRGIGFWASGVAGWEAARTLLSAGSGWPVQGAGRPAPSLMPANERRRAPDSVLLALAVAEEACRSAGVQAATLPSVFASAFGDLAINDYLCTILRDDPAAMSPTRFHNSVHNAPSGYWGIATGAMTPTTALAAARDTFAAGLLEAACQAGEAECAVLLVSGDCAGTGPIGEVAGVSHAFGCALVLDPDAGAGPGLRLCTQPAAGGLPQSPVSDAQLAALCAGNPVASAAIPLLHALATGTATTLSLPLSPRLALGLELLP